MKRILLICSLLIIISAGVSADIGMPNDHVYSIGTLGNYSMGITVMGLPNGNVIIKVYRDVCPNSTYPNASTSLSALSLKISEIVPADPVQPAQALHAPVVKTFTRADWVSSATMPFQSLPCFDTASGYTSECSWAVDAFQWRSYQYHNATFRIEASGTGYLTLDGTTDTLPLTVTKDIAVNNLVVEDLTMPDYLTWEGQSSSPHPVASFGRTLWGDDITDGGPLAATSGTVGIYSAATGNLVRTLTVPTFDTLPSTPINIEWDGRDSGGALAPRGFYSYEVTLQHVEKRWSFPTGDPWTWPNWRPLDCTTGTRNVAGILAYDKDTDHRLSNGRTSNVVITQPVGGGYDINWTVSPGKIWMGYVEAYRRSDLTLVDKVKSVGSSQHLDIPDDNYYFLVHGCDRGDTSKDHYPRQLLVRQYSVGLHPTVTIDQAASQADPSVSSPINFTVVFSAPVTGFATGDVTITGTAGGTKTATVTGSGTTYNVAVSGVTSSGTVIASIPAGVCIDAAGSPNVASTSTDNTVTYQTVIYVKPGGSNGNGGRSWTDAVASVQKGIDIASDSGGGDVWVAAGTYVKGSSSNVANMKSHVKLYGGFAVGDTSMSARNWRNNPTILDGEANNNVALILSVVDCQIDGFTIRNGWAGDGAGICCNSASATIANNIIRDNYAQVAGAGIDAYACTLTVAGNVIVNNDGDYGVGIHYHTVSGTIANNTVIDNVGGDIGGIMMEYCSPTLSNNIVAYNVGGGIYKGTGSPTFTKNDVYGNGYHEYSWTTSYPVGNDLVPVDPQITNVAWGDWHIAGTSPCRDTGAALTLPLDKDIDCESRPYNSTPVDIGADEWHGTDPSPVTPAVHYVRPGGSGTKTGDSWGNAADNLQTAINAASVAGGGEVWVAAGTYNNTNASLDSYVKLYGGFYGNEADKSARDWKNNPTTLDGGASGSVVTMEHVVQCVIDGFIIQNGVGDAAGGGIASYGTSVKIENNIVRGNQASFGGGLYAIGTNAVVAGNAFVDNAGVYYGGGIDFYDSDGEIANNTIINNENSYSYGGGIYLYDSSPHLSNNIVGFNSGGGIYKNYGYATFTKDDVYGNSGYQYNWTGSHPQGDLTPIDPVIPNISTGDWHIAGTSPCVDAGASLAVPLDKDIDAESRIHGSAVDIGADEFQDTTPPTGGSISINGGASYCTSTSVTLTLSASDSGSGMSQMRFSNNNTDWSSAPVAYSTTQAYTLASGADGARTVYVKFKDNAGNWSSAVSDGITLDTTAPTGGSISINGGASSCTSTSVTLTLSASDSGSGMSEMRFSNDGTDWSSAPVAYSTTQAYTLASGADGPRTVYVKFVDNAGNWSSAVSDGITLQTVPGATVFYVKPGGTGTTGADWSNAVGTVQAGIDLANAAGGGEVWVAQGTYNDTNAYLGSHVKLYGGFYGNETDRSQRNWKNNPTILDGGQNGSVVYIEEVVECVVDGFTIRNGYEIDGGGIDCDDTSATIENNIISGNSACLGGGLCTCYSTLTIAGNVFVDNYADYDGGGINFQSSDGKIANNTIILNNAGDVCGGLYLHSGSPDLSNNIVASNSNGGIAIGSASPTFTNDDSYGNSGYNYDWTTTYPDNDLPPFDPGIPNIGLGDWHIASNSLCINAGAPLAVTMEKDIDAQNRIYNSIVDIGADEWNGN